MNEVSIIINGVRYNTIQTEEFNACNLREIRDFTQLKSGGCICNVLMLPYDIIFKESNKSLNHETPNSKEDNLLPSFFVAEEAKETKTTLYQRKREHGLSELP